MIPKTVEFQIYSKVRNLLDPPQLQHHVQDLLREILDAKFYKDLIALAVLESHGAITKLKNVTTKRTSSMLKPIGRNEFFTDAATRAERKLCEEEL